MLDKTYPTMTKFKKRSRTKQRQGLLSNYRHSGETDKHTNKATKKRSDNLLIRINQEYWRGIPGFKYHTTGRLILITRQVYNFLEYNAKKPIFSPKISIIYLTISLNFCNKNLYQKL